MNTGETIRARRSIRQYSQQMPEDKDIQKILKAGIWAPSGLNNQPWKFKLLKNEQKNGLAEFTKYSRIVKEAPIAICVFLDNSATYNREKDIMAVGACIQNMLLQAYDLGLGSCWLGEIINQRVKAQEYLKTDSDYELMAVISLGYPDEELTRGCRKKLNNFMLRS